MSRFSRGGKGWVSNNTAVANIQNPSQPPLTRGGNNNVTLISGFSSAPLFTLIKHPFGCYLKVEEEVGFEPTERLHVRQFSRLLRSTALALLQNSVVSCSSILYYKYQLSRYRTSSIHIKPCTLSFNLS